MMDTSTPQWRALTAAAGRLENAGAGAYARILQWLEAWYDAEYSPSAPPEPSYLTTLAVRAYRREHQD